MFGFSNVAQEQPRIPNGHRNSGTPTKAPRVGRPGTWYASWRLLLGAGIALVFMTPLERATARSIDISVESTNTAPESSEAEGSLDPSAGTTEPVRKGDTQKEVLRKLGEPKGQMQLGQRQAYIYPRGQVVLRESEVVKADLVPRERFQREQEEQREQQEQREQEDMERRREGLQVMTNKLRSAEFRAKPIDQRLTFWQQFEKKYPGIDASDQIEPLRKIKKRRQRRASEDDADKTDQGTGEGDSAQEDNGNDVAGAYAPRDFDPTEGNNNASGSTSTSGGNGDDENGVAGAYEPRDFDPTD